MNVSNRFNSVKASVAGGTALALASTGAMAGELATAITTEVTSAKAEIMLVAAIMLGLTGVILLIKYVRKAAH
jgi:hypothetical protein